MILRKVTKRYLWRSRPRDIPIVVDILECGHEIVDTGPRMAHRLCRECPHDAARIPMSLTTRQLVDYWNELEKRLASAGVYVRRGKNGETIVEFDRGRPSARRAAQRLTRSARKRRKPGL